MGLSAATVTRPLRNPEPKLSSASSCSSQSRTTLNGTSAVYPACSAVVDSARRTARTVFSPSRSAALVGCTMWSRNSDRAAVHSAIDRDGRHDCSVPASVSIQCDSAAMAAGSPTVSPACGSTPSTMSGTAPAICPSSSRSRPVRQVGMSVAGSARRTRASSS